MTTLDPTVIAAGVAADCLLTIAEREAHDRAHVWLEPTGTGTACVELAKNRVMVVTHAYAPHAAGYAYCVAETGGEALQLERDEAVAYIEGCFR